mgnify:CR=1 FL=1
MDLAKIKAKLAAINQAKQKKDNKTWKPTEGNQVIRIVPNKFDKDVPFVELYFHYEFGGKSKKTLLSPVTSGNTDPIQEFADKLKRTGSKEDWSLGRRLEPKLRIYVPIIVRGEEEKGVRYWGFGKEVYAELLSFIDDPDYGDIADVSSGRDITVVYTPADKTGKTFASTSVRVKPAQTPLADSKAEIKKLLEDQVEIASLFEQPTYSELQQYLEDWLAASTDGEDEDEKAPAAESNYNSSKVEADFSKLFKEGAPAAKKSPAKKK